MKTALHATLEVVPVESKADLKAFLKLPWRIYRDDLHWVPPLLSEQAKVLDRASHPFHQHADVAYFMARRNGEVVGRISASINHLSNEFHDEKIGNFGFFECIDDADVAAALLRTAEEWLAARNMRAVQGPMNFSTNDEFSSPGILIDGFNSPPYVMMSHNPPYYARLLEQNGYIKSKDLLAYYADASEIPTRLINGVTRASRAQKITLRTLNMKALDKEISRIKDVYNSAWERNWGFVPMTEAEFEHMAHSLKPVVDPRLCIIAEIDGEAIGFALQLRDLNMAFKHMNGRLLPFGWAKFLWYKRDIPRVRVLTLGIKPEHRNKGIDGMLILQLMIEAGKLGCARGECSWILEDNMPMRRGMERIGGYVHKTYRVYEKQLGSD